MKIIATVEIRPNAQCTQASDTVEHEGFRYILFSRSDDDHAVLIRLEDSKVADLGQVSGLAVKTFCRERLKLSDGAGVKLPS